MKHPKQMWDRSPLQEEPFLTQFVIRKMMVQERGRRGDHDKWVAGLAKDMHDEPNQRAAAAQWSNYAFAPEDGFRASNRSRTVDHASVKSIEVFVRFYWALYGGDERRALDVVNRERRNRGFDYRLPPPSAPTTSPNQVNRALEPHPGRADASDGEASQPSGSRGMRAARRGRGRRLGEANADAGKSRKIVDGPSTERTGGTAVAGVTGGVKTSARTAGNGQTAATVSSSASEIPIPSSDISICDSYLAMGFPEEDKGEVIFPDDRAAAAFVVTHSQPQDPPPPAVVVTPEEPPDNHALGKSPTPSAVRPAPPSDISETTAVEDPEPAAAEAPTKSRKPRRKMAQKEASQETTRQRHPRAAANQQRLTLLAKRDLEYHSQVKRGRVDELDDLPPAPAARQPPAMSHPPPRAKKSKLRPPSEDSDDPMEVCPETQGRPALRSSSVATPRPPRRSPAAATASGPTLSTVNPSQRKKRSKRTKVRKISATDESVRPPKRHRGKDSEANPTGASHDAAPQEERRRKTPSTTRSKADGKGIQAARPSMPAPSAASTNERAQSNCVTANASGSGGSWFGRLLAKQKRAAARRQPISGLRLPVPARGTLGIPADLPEADRMVSDFATEALMDLQNTATVTDEWTPDLEAMDAPPDEEEEEEEDVPLSQVVSARHRVQGEAPSEVTPAIPSASLFPSTSSFSVAGPPPPVIPKRVGTGVPRPITAPSSLVKKPLTARPIIWAKSRQEVCESFDWFRSYQSGVYHSNDLVKGYLLSAFSSNRDIFARDGRLIISHGGGKAQSVHQSKGKRALRKASDQEEGDKSVRALLTTYREGRPIALLIDDRYALFPYDLSSKLDCTYVVLGFYHIAHAWAERQPADNDDGFAVRYKFAFEWCDKQPEPWWIKQDESSTLGNCSIPPSPKEDNPTAQYSHCPLCHERSPLVYEQGWMCLRPSCSMFWTFVDGRSPPRDFTYSESFLNAQHACDHEDLEDIRPQPPATEARNGVITSRRFRKGWHCKECGRLSCRDKWQYWECHSCGATLQVMGMIRQPREFWGQKHSEFLTHKVYEGSDIQESQMLPYRVEGSLGHGFYRVFVLPDNRGRIYMIMGSRSTHKVADEIFAEYQGQATTGDLQFKRWPMRRHQVRGELLTNYFSQNTGEPYQYVGGTANTVPFDGAPSAVVKARDLIQSRMMSVLQGESEPYRFNEVLSAAYMEEQSMAFHSDAEDGLGPRVASLSLGSCALMHFRPVKKHRQVGQKSNALTLFLRHGDVLVMDGADVQEYYEHTVVPLNFRIAATARRINNSGR